MKLQHLAVIFCIIIIPISLVLSTYTGNLIKVANTRKSYDAVLQNATYDAVRAYQMNTMHNSYASVNKSRERDLLASVNSFYETLSTGLSYNGYSKLELNDFIPAILFTLYDGYYVYGPLKNNATVYTDTDGNKHIGYREDNNGSIEYGLKPYTYYSCEYAEGNADSDGYDITINYTLDNYITVSGTYKGNYFTAAGYYIKANTKDEDSDDYIEINDYDRNVTIVKKDGNTITIRPEKLGEYITFSDEIRVKDIRSASITNPAEQVKPENQTTRVIKSKADDVPKYYNYINYNEVKYYYEPDSGAWNEDSNTTFNNVPIFYLENNSRVYISPNLRDEIKNYIWGNRNDKDIANFADFVDTNAYHYYRDAYDFSKSVYDYLKDIDITKDIVKTESYNETYQIQTSDDRTTRITNTAHTKVQYENSAKPFDYKNMTDNNPEEETSIFNNHRIDVIVCSIESSLVNAIGNFNNYVSSSYRYSMPTLSEEDWYTIATNLTTVSFMEGIPVGNYEFYTSYAVVANTKNKEFISKEAIYVQNTVTEADSVAKQNGELRNNYVNDSAPQYHYAGCNGYNADNPTSVVGYRNIDYELQPIESTYIDTELRADGRLWVVRHDDGFAKNITKEVSQSINYYLQPGTASYECMVARNDNDITLEDIMKQKKQASITLGDGTVRTFDISAEVERAYITALAREKGVDYKNHSNLNYHQYYNGTLNEVTEHTYSDITSNSR